MPKKIKITTGVVSRSNFQFELISSDFIHTKLWTFSIKYIKQFKFKMLTYIILVFTIGGIKLIQPILSAAFIDSLAKKKNFPFIKLIILATIIMSLLYILLSYILGIIETKLLNRISFNYILDIMKHFQHLPLSKISNYDPVYITQRIKGDSTNVVSFLMREIINSIMNTISIIVSGVFLLSISKSFIYLFLIFLPTYFLLYTAIRKPLYIKGYNAKDSTDQFTKMLTQQTLLIKSIKIYSSFYNSILQIKKQFDVMFNDVITYTKLSYIFSSLDSIITMAFQTVVFIIFAKKIYINEISIGEFTLINTYFAFIINSVKYFMSLGKSYQDMKVSQNRLDEILSQGIENNGSYKMQSIETVTVENVSFSYDFYQKDKTLVLKNLNLIFKRDCLYIIKGKNGSGKSTMFDILIGIYQQELESGSVKFNNEKMESIDMYWIRKNNIGFVSQSVYYGNETVVEFIVNNYYDMELPDNNSYNNIIKENVSVSKELTTNEIYSKLIEYDMKKYFVNENFNVRDLFNKKMQELSGGQRQKILILREILSPKDILFFDEPTSSLDQKSISELKEIILSLKKNRIILIITHDNYFDNIADEEIKLV